MSCVGCLLRVLWQPLNDQSGESEVGICAPVGGPMHNSKSRKYSDDDFVWFEAVYESALVQEEVLVSSNNQGRTKMGELVTWGNLRHRTHSNFEEWVASDQWEGN